MYNMPVAFALIKCYNRSTGDKQDTPAILQAARLEKKKGKTHMNSENTMEPTFEEFFALFDELDDEKQFLVLAYLRALAQKGDEEKECCTR